MKLETLTINQMPGFSQGGPQLENLSNGLNIVVGTNGSGKTTICKAIKGLLSRESLNRVKPVDISSRWKEDTKNTLLERKGNTIRCQVNGIDREPDVNLPRHLANCFTITHDELNVSGHTHQQLTEDVMRQTAGGYSLRDLKENDSRLKPGVKHGRKDLRIYQEKTSELRRLQGEQEELLQEENRLDQLELEKKEARKAEKTLEQLRKAGELVECRDRMDLVRAELDEFPAGMKRFQGDELEKLEEIKKDTESAKEALEQERKKREKAKQQLASSRLKEPVSKASLDRNRKRLNHIRSLESTVSDLKRRENNQLARLQKAGKDLSAVQSAKELDRIDVKKLDKIETLYDRSVNLKEKKSAIAGQIERLAGKKRQMPSETIREGITRLREWLRIPETVTSSGLLPVWVIWICAALIASFAVYMAVTLYIWAYLLLIPAVLIIVASIKRRSSDYREQRDHVSRQYLELSLHEITSWTLEQVQSTLKNLEELYIETRNTEQELLNRERLKQEFLKIQKKEEEISVQWKEIMAEMGIDLSISELSIVQFANRLIRYHQCRDEWTGIRGERKTVEAELSESLEAVNQFFKGFDYPVCKNSGDVEGTLIDLEERHQLFAVNSAILDDCEEKISRESEKLSEYDKRKRDLFNRLQLDPSGEDILKDRISRLEAFQTAHQTFQNLKNEADLLKRQLKRTPEFIDLERDEIAEHEAEARDKAEQFNAIVEQIEKIRYKVEQAKQSQKIEAAIEEVERCRDRIYQNRQEALFAASGNLLLDLVASEYEISAQPPVIQEANRLFSLFTNGRYSLRVDTNEQNSGDDFFRAYDNRQELGLYLDELSTGTLVQLLLAIRLAYVTSTEGEKRLPILLDETLNSSDPERFGAIAGSLLKLVQENARQVFYFTCQPVDARVWEHYAQKENYRNTTTINLDRISSEQKALQTPLDLSEFKGEEIPAPGSRDLAEYGEVINAPGFDPASPIGDLHLIHVMDTPQQLYDLLQTGIRTWGQIQTLIERNVTGQFISDEALTKAGAKAKLLKSFARSWRIGRGKPIDRDTLLDAGITQNFIEAVMEVVARVNFNAAALVEAMENKEVSRLRTDTITSVKEKLIDEGYIDLKPVLDKEEVLGRVLGDMADDIDKEVIGRREVFKIIERYWHAIHKVA